jgi:hypothetical protein
MFVRKHKDFREQTRNIYYAPFYVMRDTPLLGVLVVLVSVNLLVDTVNEISRVTQHLSYFLFPNKGNDNRAWKCAKRMKFL